MSNKNTKRRSPPNPPVDKSDTSTSGGAAAASAGSREPPKPTVTPLTPIEELILEFGRSPEKYAYLSDPNTPLPKGLSAVLARVADNSTGLTNGVNENANADEAKQVAALAKALPMFVQRVCLVPNADHYRVLGLTPNTTTEDVHRHYRWLRRAFWDAETEGSGQAAIMRISEAYVALREPQMRRAYNEKHFGRVGNVFIDETKVNTRVVPKRPTAQYRSRRGKAWTAIFLVVGAAAAGYWLQQGDTHSDVAELSGALSQQPSAAAEPTSEAESAVGETQSFETLPERATPESIALPAPTAEPEVPSTPDAVVADATVSTSQETASNVDDAQLLSRVDEFVRGDSTQDSVATSAEDPVESPVAVQPTPEPVTQPEPVIDESQAKIEKLLARANEQVEGALLTQPSGNNAYETYQEILAIDSTNVDARKGLRSIADRYIGLARYRLQRERFVEALDMAEKGLAIEADHDQLLVLKALAEEGIAAQRAQSEVPTVAAQSPTSPAISTPTPAEAASAPRTTVTEPASPPAGSATPTSPSGIAVIPVAPADIASTTRVSPPVETKPVAPTPSATSAAGISDAALRELLRQFVSGYEAGRLDDFMNLFTDDVRTNNRVSKAGVREDYAALFDSTDSRLMRLREVRWSRDEDSAIGEGDFSLNIIKQGENRPRSFEGSLTFQVRLDGGVPKIRGLYHAQRKVAR